MLLRALISPRRTAAIGALLLCALIAIFLFIWSPWHRHDSFSGQVCSFSQFEHGAGLEPGSVVHFVPPSQLAVLITESETVSPLLWRSLDAPGRAPPAIIAL
jgi:hypothetical protein